MTELEIFRKEKDEYFKTDRHSPLKGEDRDGFSGLNYFPENPALHFQPKLERHAEQKDIMMQTSTGEYRNFIKTGQVRFSINGVESILQVYENEHGYFLPFIDATAPDETYGAGRYLDPHDLGNGFLDVDFNLAYNPYCAYNENFSCPIPPRENKLAIRIEAGEKNYHN